MANHEQSCYIYIQLPGTMQTVPCASLKVRAIGAGVFEGSFTYGKRYLEQAMLPPSFFRTEPPGDG